MDSDGEINDDDSLEYYSDSVRRRSFPEGCRDEVQGIETLFTCFMERYNECPAFFMGSLRDACRKAFDSPVIREHCPILVYIHHEQAPCAHIFCQKVFCSDIIINYLLDNYIVWPWDITHASNRDRLIEFWRDVFPNEPVLDFTMEQCPMLIGIINRSRYKFTSLLQGDSLIHTEKFSPQVVLNELSIFRDKFEALFYEISPRNVLDADVIVEICKYLSLNDAIKAFTSRILVYLQQSDTKVHITEPCEALFETIARRIKPEQIVSLCLNTDESSLKMIVDFLPKFHQIISLTLLNLQVLEVVSEYGVYFPNLTRLSLRYTNEIGFNMMKNILPCLPETIRRLEIHCTRVLCTHYEVEQFDQNISFNYQIKYFLLNLDQYPLISSDECFQQYKACFLMTTIDLLKYIRNLRYVHLIINQYDLDKLLDMTVWKDLLFYSHFLKKVTVQILGNISQDEILAKKIIEMQDKWRYTGRNIKFQVISS